MGTKLFVDDVRRCPEGWTLARTVTEAIRILDTQEISECSLDHDITCMVLGQEHTSNETFEPVARFLSYCISLRREVRCCYNRPRIRIHTSNFEAGRKMADILAIDYDQYIYDPNDYK